MMLYYMGYYFHPSYILVIIASILVLMAQAKVNNAYSKYSKIDNDAHLTGEQVARMIIERYGLNVRVQKVSGHLSDHYDPSAKVVRLSTEIYEGRSIAALAVAAHECGHALQHQENYVMLKVRSGLLPLANGGNYLGWFAIMIGLLASNFTIAMIGFFMLCFMLLFQLATLPVEFDASKRALNILESDGFLDMNETGMAKNMLQAAALTYVAGVASTMLNLLRVLWMILGSSRRD